ncbi:MAG: hypothetical protein IKM46_08805 [Clostridia bacterium]|nr:hypothetical protein [Clostridia bacterium]
MLKLPKIFQNGMVLQRDVPVKIWGEADCPVTVSIDMHSAVDFQHDGKFSLTIPPHEAGGPYTMFIECGGEIIKLHDIYYGDVFLAAGQSNMGMPIDETDETLDECDKVIRIFTPDRIWDEIDMRRPETDDRWIAISMENAHGISAAASHFAVDIANRYDIPVGIISCNQGASSIRSWLSPETVAKDPVFALNTRWHTDCDIFSFINTPSEQYLERLVPLAPYTVKAVLWYQGESDADTPIAYSYKHLFELLVDDWRRLWNDADLPFITTQLTYHTVEFHSQIWEILREQQLAAADEGHNIGMITIGDAGAYGPIHPMEKKVVGKRLALYAMGMLYGENILYRPPVCRKATKSDGKVILSFSDAGEGLYETKPLEFYVISSDGLIRKAKYVISGSEVILDTEAFEVSEVRFCFAPDLPVWLYSSAGLPASPFRISVS